MSDMLRPDSAEDVADAIADAARSGAKLMLRGGGSKADIGAPAPDAIHLDLRGFDGVIDYDPAELVLTAGAGTPLATIRSLLAERQQALAFDPFDHGPIFGRKAGDATIGGVISAAVAGSARLSQGGARDHLLGFKAVSGRGEPFVAGAKVVKNVTGFDLPKLAAASWGRLFAMTEVTLKVLPASPERQSWIMRGLDVEQAVAAMSRVLGSQVRPNAAAHIPAGLFDSEAITAFRIEGVAPSITARAAILVDMLSGVALYGEGEADALWDGLHTLAPLWEELILWRVNVPQRAAPAVIAAVAPFDARWMMDWGGGLLWVGFSGDPAILRNAAQAVGGHAMLIRAPKAIRAETAIFHPPASGVAALEQRVRRAFDPQGIFETGRFGSA